MAKTPAYKVNIGTISRGTMRNEDLIPAFARLLDDLRDPANLAHAAIVKESYEMIEHDLLDSEDAAWMLNEGLFDALNEYAPEDCYFGAIEGDGSDFGFWPVWA